MICRPGYCRPLLTSLIAVIGVGCGIAGARAQEVDTGTAAPSPPPSSPPLAAEPTGSLLQSGPPQPGGTGSSGALTLMPGDSLRDRIESALGLAPAQNEHAPAVQFKPAVSLQQGWTSNALNLPDGRSAFLTVLNPSITVTADTQRVQGALTYAPSLNLYEPSMGQSTFAQNLAGQVHTILIPDTFFIDLNAFADQQTVTGGFGPSGTVAANRANTAQDYSFSLSPYLQQRFGDLGVGELGGSITEAGQLVPSDTVVALQAGLPATQVFSQHATTTEEHLALTSGDAFGRWLSSALASFSQSEGTGVLSGAHRDTIAYEAGYAVTRNVTALATIGWDDLHYAGVPPVNVDSALWNVGVKLTPNADSQITIRYGRKDGIDAPFVSATYAPTARTRITANYSVTLSTDTEQLTDVATNATTDPYGNPISAVTGQPLLAGSNFLGLLDSVYKLEVASVVGTLLLNRDTFQIAFNQQDQIPRNFVPGEGEAPTAQKGTFGSVSWSHDVSDLLKVEVLVQYGVADTSVGGVSQTSGIFTGSALLSYLISPTLSASLQYSHTMDSYRTPVPGFSTDLVLAGVHKTF